MKRRPSKYLYRIEQVLILLAHLVMLWWIMHLLEVGGDMTTEEILPHFIGIGIYGAALIRGCAYLAKQRFIKEQQEQA